MGKPDPYMSDFKPYKIKWWIQGKVVHTWKQFSEQFGEALEIIFFDKKVDNFELIYICNRVINSCIMQEKLLVIPTYHSHF